jgi:hypothetical protein
MDRMEPLILGLPKSSTVPAPICSSAWRCAIIIVCYHIRGSMILNARSLHLAHMVYFWPKHSLLLAQYTVYIEVHAHNLFLSTPLLLGNPSLTYLEIPTLCRGANSRPLLSQVGSVLKPPRPPPPFPLSPSNGSPCSNACPLKTTLRYRLHIVRYNYVPLSQIRVQVWFPCLKYHC